MTNKQRLDEHDRQIAAIRTLVKQGMRMLVNLASAQRKTDANLNALISALRQSGGNGHSKRKVDLQ
jgi:hypothetical protein